MFKNENQCGNYCYTIKLAVIRLLFKPPTLFLQGYMMKKGHKRKNWTERWFVLKPNVISYYVGEDLAEKKGDILLDGNCSVEARTCCL